MKIKLRGKIWKQITEEEYDNISYHSRGNFQDLSSSKIEWTYFKLIIPKKKTKKEIRNNECS